MKHANEQDGKIGRGVLLALAVVLLTTTLGFYLTGSVNQIPVMANAPAVAAR